MPYKVTDKSVEHIMSILNYEWHGEWQKEIVQACIDYPEIVIQGPRQVTGKTWCVALYEACRIIAGHTATIGYPTMTQGTRLLGERIINNVDQFGSTIGKAINRKFWKKPKEQATYRHWVLAEDPNHEGKLYSLSANETSIHLPEGYTTDDLVLDESHRLTERTLGIFEPFTDVASKQGNATITYMGVGGFKTSLIEKKKLQSDIKVIRYTADDIIAMDPAWKPVLEKRKASLPDWQWRQHYMCEQSSEGQRFMHPSILPGIDVTECIQQGQKPILCFGIDVGRVRDSTVVKVISTVNKIIDNEMRLVVNEIDSFEMMGDDYELVADAVYSWINGRFYWRPERIVVELNGPGIPFHDMLCKRFGKRINGIHTGAENKLQFWNELCMAISEGCFGVEDEIARTHYESMMYAVAIKDGKIEFEHSDYWMGLFMAWSAMGKAESL